MFEIMYLAIGIMIGYWIGALFVWFDVRRRSKKLSIWKELNEV